MKVVVCDTETGGLNPRYSLLTAAFILVDLNEGKIIDSIDFQFEPEEFILNADAMEVNKLDVRDWNGCTYQDGDSQLKTWLRKHFVSEKAIFCAHNAMFDMSFVQAYLPRSAKQFSFRLLDTTSFGLLFTKQGLIASPSLNCMLEYFNIKQDESKRHTALHDAELTADLIIRIMNIRGFK